jgi:nicotinamidase-related amidase
MRHMNPKQTAVVLIEYQNDFTSEGGTLHQAVKPVMESTNMLANSIETVKKARELGATIVYAPITVSSRASWIANRFVRAHGAQRSLMF